jgi:hypothetical protein
MTHPWPQGAAFIERQQVLDWHTLYKDILGAINGYWSIAAEGTVTRIREAAELVGPTPRYEVPYAIDRAGLYDAVLNYGSIEQPEPLPREERRRLNRLMMSHVNPQHVERCRKTVQALADADRQEKS